MSGFTTLNCVFNKSLNLLKPVRVSILEFSPQTGRIDDTNRLCVWVRSPKKQLGFMAKTQKIKVCDVKYLEKYHQSQIPKTGMSIELSISILKQESILFFQEKLLPIFKPTFHMADTNPEQSVR